MAECGAARCLQDRRCFRKELQKWRQNLLYMLGYESIAEGIVGRSRWNNVMKPLNENQPTEPTDWKPTENCLLCQNKKISESETVLRSQPLETSSAKTLEEKVTIRYLEELLPNWSPMVPPHYPVPAAPPDPDQPLDLSMTSKECAMQRIKINLREREQQKMNSNVIRVPELKKKQGLEGKLKKVRPGEGPMRRNYTEDELRAAVDDIRNGKLGTRRAAVLYGIPRSTLRNKVYKLEAEQAHAYQKKSQVPSRSTSPAQYPSASQSLRDLIHKKITDSLQASPNGDTKPEKVPEKPLMLFPAAATRRTLTSRELLEKKPSDLKDKLKSSIPYNSDIRLPFLSEFIRNLTEERLQEERKNVARINGDDSADFILKIPSYKPTRPLTTTDILSTESKAFGDALKSIIAKNISEHVRNHCYQSQSASQSDEEDSVGRPSSSRGRESTGSNMYVKDCKPMGKGTRPKRGRYRNYDHDNLAMAVQSVQRGEMSVHRAGTFYGVPHSTLEYKVKERHLLRKRKIQDQKEQQRVERLQRIGLYGGDLIADDSGDNSTTSSVESEVKKETGSESSQVLAYAPVQMQQGSLYMSELLKQLKGRYDQAMAGTSPHMGSWPRDSVINYVQGNLPPAPGNN
ncbi:PREDICTED: ligand-dependent nuclear receptor corepressor-like protein [Priapulus caudatus]|uniref:Ligand-dependent nuclear receptor corepressor-like protein n=1 Tax=Priapulus caudatus TaxID=37621 RepID=A0ABM1DS32_PRICU|nr:PREDICTED: ligand-dependent nuclear receptor corepressor-like protein [Priapulus caudatus]